MALDNSNSKPSPVSSIDLSPTEERSIATVNSDTIPDLFISSNNFVVPEYNVADEVCELCGELPCEWITFGPTMKQRGISLYFNLPDGTNVDRNGVVVPNNPLRKNLYKMFIFLKYGRLGAGQRIELPKCVYDGIKELYPSSDGVYMGFHQD